MGMFNKVDVGGGLSDFWSYIREPRPHRWAIWGVALALTWLIFNGVEKYLIPYEKPKEQIIYFENWTADRSDAEIHEGAGEQGHFSPWSWWPLVLGLSCATGFLGLAVGFWIVYIAAGMAVVALIGWVYEYSRGDHAH